MKKTIVSLAALMLAALPALAEDGGLAVQAPWTWATLATVAGAAAATLLIVQYLKVPLDKVWKIPTRAFVYMVAFAILAAATAFVGEMSAEALALCALNAFVVSLTAYGSYEVTFGKDGGGE